MRPPAKSGKGDHCEAARGRTRETGRRTLALRLLLWLLLFSLLPVAIGRVSAAHRLSRRGLSGEFPAPVRGADVPLPGVNVALEQYDGQALEDVLRRIAAGGFVWVRQTFYFSRIVQAEGHFDWSVPDRIFAALSRYPQLRPVVVLDDAPPTPPADPERFAAFARAFASRYSHQVDVYQVWDEPNLAAHWGGGPVSPPAYADLLARVARAIRAADPTATILLAGLAPTTERGPLNLSEVRYLEQLYQAGAAPYFDIVAGKPYGFYTGPDDRRVDESVLNFSRLILLREVMERHGDGGKAIWATQWGWNALPRGWEGAPSIWGQTDEATQAARTVAAFERARNEWPWLGAMILEHFQPPVAANDPRWGFALVGPDNVPRPVYNAVARWATALPEAAPPGGYTADNPWSTYEGDWRIGAPGADIGSGSGRATFRFDGTSVALTVRRGPYRAFLYVTVDGQPAPGLPRDELGRAYLVLYDREAKPATVPLATDLPPGTHTVEIVPDGGEGQWAIVDWRVGTRLPRDGYVAKLAGLIAAGVILALLLAREARLVAWKRLEQRFLALPEWAQVAALVGGTGLLWYSSAGILREGWSSLWASICLLTLAALSPLLNWRADLGLALVACAAPFYLIPDGLIYRALSLPEMLIWLLSPAILRRRLTPLSALDKAVGMLMLAAIIATAAAVNRIAALFELRTVFLCPLLYYVLLRTRALNGKPRWRVVDAFVLGGCGVALIGLAQYALGRNLALAEGGWPRLQSVYHSPNNVGLYLGRVWPFLVAIPLWSETARGRRVLYGLALLPATLAVILSFSRGALLLGLPAALVAMGWQAGGRYRWLTLIPVLLCLLALLPLLRLPRFASLLDVDQGSTFFRLGVWRSSLSLIREHPWTGVGPANFLEAYRTRYVLPSAWEEFNLEHPHNVYLDHWTRLGILGVLAGAAVQIAFFKQQSRQPEGRDRGLSIALTGSMAALLAHGLVDNSLFFPDLAMAFFLLLALASPG
ncbi:MAG: O-antigen ligase family protein [Anaerolineae bacterium]|nr:O-antigen ligase family protein [Anaerolineae bacterium]